MLRTLGSASVAKLAEFPGLQKYAGQRVDTGPKAKAYANQFINAHLAAVADGKTYSQVSALSIASPNNAKLTASRHAVHGRDAARPAAVRMGWSVVSTLALYAGIAALLGFLLMGLVTLGDFIADPRIAAPHIAAS